MCWIDVHCFRKLDLERIPLNGALRPLRRIRYHKCPSDDLSDNYCISYIKTLIRVRTIWVLVGHVSYDCPSQRTDVHCFKKYSPSVFPSMVPSGGATDIDVETFKTDPTLAKSFDLLLGPIPE